MKGILQKEQGLRTGRTICQVVLMEIVRDKRVFLLSDTGVTISPTLEQKGDILRSLLETARGLGQQRPRVAIMSATEKATEAMPDTLDAVELSRRSREGEFGDCVVEGPLSFDLAYAAEAGEKKKVAGEVTGASEAMLFPNLLAANLTVKGIMYTADCRFGGILSGAACPVVFMSRADTVQTRLNSLAFALRLLQDQHH
jgi:phosphotransacetylase